MDEEAVAPVGGVLESQCYYAVIERETNRPLAFCGEPDLAARLAGGHGRGASVKEVSVTIRYVESRRGKDFNPWTA